MEVCQSFLISERHHDHNASSWSKGEENSNDVEKEVPTEGGTKSEAQEKILPMISERTLKQCELKARGILTASWEKMKNAMQTVHNKENKRKNHIRYHYDDKLNVCRVSYKLQNNHEFKVLQLRKKEDEAEMQCVYESQINDLSLKLNNAKDVIRVQENTVLHSQLKALHTEKELEQTKNAYQEYKKDMTQKYDKLECDWNRIKKQEVWAHFKIMTLKKKVKKHERSLVIKKTQHRSLLKEIQDLSERLRVSVGIRTGLEKAFEKRARIRGRLDIMNQQEMMRYNQTPLQKSRTVENGQQNNKKCITRSCQTEERSAEMKDRGCVAPPFLDDIVKSLQFNIENIHKELRDEREQSSVAKRQNEAYRRLISGKNIALILATEHRNLFERPNSMEAKILFELTQPNGILLEKKSASGLHCDDDQGSTQKRRDSTRIQGNKNERKSAPSIPSTNKLTGFDGLKGKFLDHNK